MEEAAELRRGLAGEQFEDSAHVTLVGEAGFGCQTGKIGPASLESAADKLHT